MTHDPMTPDPMTPDPPISFPAPELAGGATSDPPPRPAPVSNDPAGEAEREDAFSDEPQWDGRLLFPFSVERYGIFVSQRVSMGAPSLYDALRDGSAFFPDAVRILWICSHLPAALSRLRPDPAAMQEAMDAWAEDHVPVHRGAEAVAVAIRIFNAANVNRHAVRTAAVESPGTPPKNAHGRSGAPNT